MTSNGCMSPTDIPEDAGAIEQGCGSWPDISQKMISMVMQLPRGYRMMLERLGWQPEDIVQETSLQLYQSPHSRNLLESKPLEELSGYLYVAMCNTARGVFRRHKRKPDLIPTEYESTGDTSSDLHLAEYRADIRQAITTLSEIEWQVFYMSRIERCTIREIMQKTNMSLGGVFAARQRAEKKLQSALREPPDI